MEATYAVRRELLLHSTPPPASRAVKDQYPFLFCEEEVVNSEEEGLELAGTHPKIIFVGSFTEPTNTFIAAEQCIVKSEGLRVMACYALSLEYPPKLSNVMFIFSTKCWKFFIQTSFQIGYSPSLMKSNF